MKPRPTLSVPSLKVEATRGGGGEGETERFIVRERRGTGAMEEKAS
jgi:hypothetical protein